VIGSRPVSAFLRATQAALAILLVSLSLSAKAQTVQIAGAAPSADSSGALSLDAYRARLQNFDQLISNCERAPSTDNCKSSDVGPDVKVAIAGSTRQIRLDWLRGLLDEAAETKPAVENHAPAAAAPAPTQEAKPGADSNSDDDEDDDSNQHDAQTPNSPVDGKQIVPQISQSPVFTPPTLAEQMHDAHERIASELASISAAPPASAAATQHKLLKTILTAPEYKIAVAPPSLKDRLLEMIGNWLDKFFTMLFAAGAKSKWIGYTVEAIFGILVCLALGWFIIRLERQGRLGSELRLDGPGAGAASARDWQLWLQDARNAAAAGAFRDAIHLVYWASISRLESSGQWPADRARTPREYLALLAPGSAQRSDLAAITRSFERIWYGGHSAAETDYQRAEETAARLGAGSSSRNRAGAA
jgi:Domain of unknown function (DUF4129)